MGCYYLDLYSSFSCLAGQCPSTCCSGWKIVVDEEAKKRFEELEDEGLRRDILGHLQRRQGELCFETCSDGRCSMLDGDGLCRIQKRLDEKALCNTCRKFPRITARVGGDIWMSMAASCPVVAGHLWRQETGWVKQDEKGACHKTDVRELQPVAEGMALYKQHCRVNHETIYQITAANPQFMFQSWEGLPGEQSQYIIRKNWQCFTFFLDLADGCLGLMREFPEQWYLEGSFEYFGLVDKEVSDILQDIGQFVSAWHDSVLSFVERYLPYRLFGRFLECQKENAGRRYCQVMGEVALIYLILFSRYSTLGRIGEEQIIETINWVYRFCVHGKHRSEKLTEMFCNILGGKA